MPRAVSCPHQPHESMQKGKASGNGKAAFNLPTGTVVEQKLNSLYNTTNSFSKCLCKRRAIEDGKFDLCHHLRLKEGLSMGQNLTLRRMPQNSFRKIVSLQKGEGYGTRQTPFNLRNRLGLKEGPSWGKI